MPPPEGLRKVAVWRFASRLYRRFQLSRLPLLAAALAYYAAFSIGPLLLLLGGWLGVVLRTRPELAGQYRTALTDLVAQILPLQNNSTELVNRSFEVILEQLRAGALLRSLLSVLVLIWASSNFFASLQLALEVIFEVPKARGFWRKRLVAVLLVLAVALTIGIEIIGGAVFSSITKLINDLTRQFHEFNIHPPAIRFTWERGFWNAGLRLVSATVAFTLCFRFLPRQRSSWTGALSGALFSSASILVMRRVLLLGFDIERFNLIYGVITGLLIILLWLYLALLLFLVGALLAAEVSADPSPGSPERREENVSRLE